MALHENLRRHRRSREASCFLAGSTCGLCSTATRLFLFIASHGGPGRIILALERVARLQQQLIDTFEGSPGNDLEPRQLLLIYGQLVSETVELA